MENPQIPQSLIDLERATASEMDADRQATIRRAAKVERKRRASIATMRAAVVAFIATIAYADEADIDPFITWDHPVPHSSTISNGILLLPEHIAIQFSLQIANPDDYSYCVKANGSKYLTVGHNAYNGDDLGRALVAARLQWRRQQVTDPGGDNG